MPSVAPLTPRKMLPPPITIATSTSMVWASATSSAMRARVAGSMPYCRSPIRASPESLRRTREYFAPIEAGVYTKRAGVAPAQTIANRNGLLLVRHDFGHEVIALLLDAFAELVTVEAGHDVAAAVLLPLLHEVLRNRRLVVADVRLLEQAGLAVELLPLARHHLLDDVLRLARLERRIACDLALGVEVLLRDVLAAQEARLGRRDVHRDIARNLGALRIAAGQFHDHADLAAAVHVRADRRPLRRLVTDEAADGDVLFDRGDHLRRLLRDRLFAARPLLGVQLVDRRRFALSDQLGDVRGECAEVLVAADELNAEK